MARRKETDDFAVFILTYGRADRVHTYSTLRKSGYHGRVYLVCSTDDKQIDEYRKRYGDKVLVFDKEDYTNSIDTGDNNQKKNTVLFARNACYDLAESVGVKWILQLDDDYVDFRFKYNAQFEYGDKIVRKNLGQIFRITLQYFKSIPAASIAYSQGGDFIGGKDGQAHLGVWAKRKVMNTFFLTTERRMAFIGRMNDDVNTYIVHGSRGLIMFQTSQFAVNQVQTQASEGGLTEMYLQNGTYQKSFYTVMMAPSCVKISTMGSKERRLHHQVSWKHAVPCILHERHRKIDDQGSNTVEAP